MTLAEELAELTPRAAHLSEAEVKRVLAAVREVPRARLDLDLQLHVAKLETQLLADLGAGTELGLYELLDESGPVLIVVFTPNGPPDRRRTVARTVVEQAAKVIQH
ncbi:MAG: hypothetical protein ACREVC_14330 [Burkholderiales bacterium]